MKLLLFRLLKHIPKGLSSFNMLPSRRFNLSSRQGPAFTISDTGRFTTLGTTMPPNYYTPHFQSCMMHC